MTTFIYFSDMHDQRALQAYTALLRVTLYKPENDVFEAFSQEVIQRSKIDYGFTYPESEEVNSEFWISWVYLSTCTLLCIYSL